MNITINGNEYQLQWGMGAIELYCEKMDCDIDGLSLIDNAPSQKESAKAIVTLVLSAIQNGCELAGNPFAVTYRQLQAAFDEMPQDEFKLILDDFTKSKYLGKTILEHLSASVVESDKKKEV